MARRLGSNPFRDDAARTITVRVARSGPGHGATIELEKGERRTRRTLRSPARGCAELAAAIELAVSLAVDPLWQAQEEPEVEIVDDAGAVPRPLPADLAGSSPPTRSRSRSHAVADPGTSVWDRR